MNKSLSTYITEGLKRDGKLTDVESITYPDGKVVNIADVESKFHMCVMDILNEFNYFAPAVTALVPILTNGVDTMATDGIRLFMNPRFVEGLSFNECIFVILHECMHCILNHMYREKINNFDHQLGNIAADYEVNGILEFDGMIKRGTTEKVGGLIDEKYKGWPMEKIYHDCKKSAPTPKQQGEPSQSQGDQGQSGEGGGSGNGGSGSGDQKQSPDYIKGWNQAMADYNSGKLKI